MSARKDAAVLKLAGQMRSMAKEVAKAALDVLKKKFTNYTINVVDYKIHEFEE